MSLANRFRGSSGRVVSHFGGGAKAVRREHSSLKNPATGGAPTLLVDVGAYLADGDSGRITDAAGVELKSALTPAGAQWIVFDAASMVGKMPAGAQFTISGVSGTYELSADATASGNSLDCLLTSALAGAAADDAAVTVTQAYGEKTYRATRSHYRADEIGDVFGLEDYKLELATSDEFSAEDSQLTFDGSAVKIKAVEPFSPGTEQASVILHCAG